MQVQVKYIDALVAQLNNRLPDVRELEPFSIFDPSKVPDRSQNETFDTYGNNELQLLSTHYGSGQKADINKEALLSEWVMLKQLIAEKFREISCKNFLTLVSTNDSLTTMFPNLSTLAFIARILPVSTAECERCFSGMKRIKTVLRNRMETDTLEKLMRISVEGPALDDFNFDKAADLWGSLRQRRITV